MDNESIKIEDIAKKAGVSITAVSFALNDKPGISEQTREKILKIVHEYGYISKPMVRTRTKAAERQSKTILLLNCSRTNVTQNEFDKAPFFAELLRVLEKRVSEHGYHFWIKSLNIDGKFNDNLEAILIDNSVDGIALIATDLGDEDASRILRLQPNTVVLDTLFQSLSVNCVAIDNYLGGVLAAQHLVDMGHRRFGYVQSADRIYNFEMRKEGFLSVLQKNALQIDPKYAFSVDGNSVDSSYEALKCVLSAGDFALPPAFFAENDYRAIGLIRALQEYGYAVPAQTSVVGFDDIEMASFITPGLTTIRVPIAKMADLAIKTLIRMIETRNTCNIKQMVAVELMKRGSSL